MQLASTDPSATSSASLRTLAARDQLVKDHLSLVEMIANALRRLPIGAGVPYQDLVAFGSTGLVQAAERFDDTKGVPFKTYARYRVRGAMVDGIRSHHWLSRRAYDRIRLEQVLAGATPANDIGLDGVATGGELRSPPLTHARRYQAAHTDDSDLDAAVEARWNGRRMVQLPAVGDDTTSVRLRAAIEQLPVKERRLIELCYFEDKTLEQAGAELGMQRSWACRLHARALDAVRSIFASTSFAPGS